MNKKHLFLSLLAVKAFVMIGIILFAGIGLGPDEAQYWTWSRQLDVGYYSKPPGVAWQIFLSTALFGSTELGVRMSAVILGTLFSLAVYRLGLKAGCSSDTAALAGLISAFTPLGIFSTFLAITDGGLLLFWTLALCVLVEAIHQHKTPAYPLFGLLMACGALFKWPIYLLWVVVLIGWFYYPQFRSKSVIAGVCISILGLAPTLLWNVSHDFATFRHVTTIVQGGNDGGAAANPLEFIGSQAALLSPIIFVLGIVALGFWKRASESIGFLRNVTLGILGAYIVYACFKKGQGNWCLFAYPSFFVWIAAIFSEGRGRMWVKAGLVLSIILASLIFSIPAIQKHSWFTSFPIPWKINPFRHNVGWDQLSPALVHTDSQFLFADKYQNTSLLSFYSPEQQQSYFFNLLGSRKNQFSYWEGPPVGKDGIFVVIENGTNLEEKMDGLEKFYIKALSPYFEKVNPPEHVVLFKAYGKSVKEALIFHCDHYLGKLPENPEKY